MAVAIVWMTFSLMSKSHRINRVCLPLFLRQYNVNAAGSGAGRFDRRIGGWRCCCLTADGLGFQRRWVKFVKRVSVWAVLSWCASAPVPRVSVSLFSLMHSSFSNCNNMNERTLCGLAGIKVAGSERAN